MINFPKELYFQISEPIDKAVEWILLNLKWLFEAISFITLQIFNTIDTVLGIIPWWLVIIALFFAGWRLYSVKTGIVLSLMLFSIGMFGYWDMMIYTLVIIIISVIISFLVGLPLGILMSKSEFTKKFLMPILDAMQTMPSFVYLIPAVMLFGLGKVPAVFATTIYAVPPLIRLTYLGISNVNKDIIEAGKSFGSTPKQMLFKIEIPQALSTIMTGVNQTTMMAMGMVVIASMIGGEGLGKTVLEAIRRLEVGQGFQAGLAVVFLAIILDRILQGFAKKLRETE